MSATDVQLQIETELDRVERWRAEELERAGFDPSDATLLATTPGVDLHVAVALLAHGCPVELALQILM